MAQGDRPPRGCSLADPHHVAALDGFDRFTVRAYRAGLAASALAVAGLAAAGFTGAPLTGPRVAVLVATALVVPNLHLYDRVIRWVIAVAGWLGATLPAVAALLPPGAAPWVADAGLGFSFVVLSAVALKEQWCFRLPLMPLVPALLATSLIPLRAGSPGAAAPLWAGATALLVLLAAAKARMPLHYDIGDKSRYQV